MSPSSRLRFTPSDTTRRASTSRPESVSSRIAIRGLSRRICRISWRFFSPPEKPSLTLRSANAASISRPAISVLTSLTQVRSFGASPLTAVAAVRRKFDTDTPGTSTGYCIARNRPARARSSTVIARTSSPSRVTVPPVIVYLGWPAIEYARVDLPDPLGPMIAWVSPERTVRSTPRRISLVSSPSPTVTCRSRISRTDNFSLLAVGRDGETAVALGVDQHVISLHADRVDGDRLGGRQVGGLAGAQVEARPVQPALDGGGALELLDVALGERHLGVRAQVLDGVDLTLEADDGDVDVGELDPERTGLLDVGERADPFEAHAETACSSSPGRAPRRASLVRISRSCSSGSPMCWTTSAKKPRTTSRRAVSASMPREQR